MDTGRQIKRVRSGGNHNLRRLQYQTKHKYWNMRKP